MEDISLHLLDVAENALLAGAGRIEMRIHEDRGKDTLRIEIEDDGRGMDEQAVSQALDPFYTTKPGKRVGLGLALFAQAAREAEGSINIDTGSGEGTTVRAVFRLSHPDIKPMGDLLATMATLACAHPHVRFVLDYRRDGGIVCRWDSKSPAEGKNSGQT